MADSNDQESNSTILDSGNDIDPTNVIINYVPTEYNEKKLKKIFSAFGELESVKLVRDRVTKIHKGFGFVKFASAEAASEAIHALNGKKMDDKLLKVSIARGRYDSTQRSKIMISNLPSTCTEDELESLFGEFGTIVESRLTNHKHTRKDKIGFVLFSTHAEATSALAMHDTKYKDAALIVEYSIPPNELNGSSPSSTPEQQNRRLGSCNASTCTTPAQSISGGTSPSMGYRSSHFSKSPGQSLSSVGSSPSMGPGQYANMSPGYGDIMYSPHSQYGTESYPQNAVYLLYSPRSQLARGAPANYPGGISPIISNPGSGNYGPPPSLSMPAKQQFGHPFVPKKRAYQSKSRKGFSGFAASADDAHSQSLAGHSHVDSVPVTTPHVVFDGRQQHNYQYASNPNGQQYMGHPVNPNGQQYMGHPVAGNSGSGYINYSPQAVVSTVPNSPRYVYYGPGHGHHQNPVGLQSQKQSTNSLHAPIQSTVQVPVEVVSESEQSKPVNEAVDRARIPPPPPEVQVPGVDAVSSSLGECSLNSATDSGNTVPSEPSKSTTSA